MRQLVEEAKIIAEKIKTFKVNNWEGVTTTGWFVQNGIVSFIEDELRHSGFLQEGQSIGDAFIIVPPLHAERHLQERVELNVKRIRDNA